MALPNRPCRALVVPISGQRAGARVVKPTIAQMFVYGIPQGLSSSLESLSDEFNLPGDLPAAMSQLGYAGRSYSSQRNPYFHAVVMENLNAGRDRYLANVYRASGQQIPDFYNIFVPQAESVLIKPQYSSALEDGASTCRKIGSEWDLLAKRKLLDKRSQ